jgi:hypothetical protein
VLKGGRTDEGQWEVDTEIPRVGMRMSLLGQETGANQDVEWVGCRQGVQTWKWLWDEWP